MSLDIDAVEFRQLADRVLGLAVEYGEQLDRLRIAPAIERARLEELIGDEAPEQGRGGEVVELLAKAVKGCRAQNARFLGYVMGSGERDGATADLLASVLNQNVTGWRSSPAGA